MVTRGIVGLYFIHPCHHCIAAFLPQEPFRLLSFLGSYGSYLVRGRASSGVADALSGSYAALRSQLESPTAPSGAFRLGASVSSGAARCHAFSLGYDSKLGMGLFDKIAEQVADQEMALLYACCDG